MKSNYFLPMESGNIGRTAQMWLSRRRLTACQDKQAGTRMSWFVSVLCLLILLERNTPSFTQIKPVVANDFPSYCMCTKPASVYKCFKCQDLKKRFLCVVNSPDWEGVSWHIRRYRHTRTGRSLPLPFWATLLDLQDGKQKALSSKTLCAKKEHCMMPDSQWCFTGTNIAGGGVKSSRVGKLCGCTLIVNVASALVDKIFAMQCKNLKKKRKIRIDPGVENALVNCWTLKW